MKKYYDKLENKTNKRKKAKKPTTGRKINKPRIGLSSREKLITLMLVVKSGFFVKKKKFDPSLNIKIRNNRMSNSKKFYL